jgi:hypothetical protein
LCGALFDGPSPEAMQVLVADHVKLAEHKGIALGRVRS